MEGLLSLALAILAFAALVYWCVLWFGGFAVAIGCAVGLLVGTALACRAVPGEGG